MSGGENGKGGSSGTSAGNGASAGGSSQADAKDGTAPAPGTETAPGTKPAEGSDPASSTPPAAGGDGSGSEGNGSRPDGSKDDGSSGSGADKGDTAGGTSSGSDGEAEQVVANAESESVLVNKTYRLPKGYVPDDLVYPDIPFTFTEKIDKRKLRKEAAAALEELVAGAKADGVALAGVSGYRSEARQKTLFDNYAKKDGIEAANRYSAKPGYSEHQTGLAIDMAGSDGKCAAEQCFSDTEAAKWLAKHAQEYGFIIRYPEGKEKITGYMYESWHIRYVGKKIAQEIYDKGITLEEYFGDAVPVIGAADQKKQ
ncbi:hypothetical protein VN24_07730 [Paenibacillus beijingensis]|uniref:D-alanyl-D-alanine carboxypeptidase-like core domain-containing protein n=1 Tax=Paenibacillus beijingensis TaxID=1126833 RepID=A0A0D5NRG4_9BACL|nr:hypothetical protein VN24_07730 [Paenibacillus beijingensis]